MNILVFGHVDTGKSTLCGQILVNTDDEYKRLYEQREDNDPNSLSNLLDIYESERIRCKTSEFSTFNIQYMQNEYTFIDTPGHKIYIREYIEALQKYNISCGLIVLSARGNEFESGFERGTTKEYITLAKCMGVKNLIVAINKIDTEGYSQQKFNEIKNTIQTYVNVFKFKNVDYIQTSGKNNIGLFDINGLFSILGKYYYSTTNWTVSSPLVDSLGYVDKIKVKLQIFDCKNIISAGFSCIAHFASNNIPVESELVIEKILNGKVFAKKGDIIETECTLAKSYELTRNTRIILRSDTFTIGCGIII